MASWVALVAKDYIASKVKHYVGIPPPSDGAEDARTLLPSARVVWIEERSDGVFLSRFLEDGVFVGDTWHPSREEAEHQARFEFGTSLGAWKGMPANTTEPITFALANCNEPDPGGRLT